MRGLFLLYLLSIGLDLQAQQEAEYYGHCKVYQVWIKEKMRHGVILQFSDFRN